MRRSGGLTLVELIIAAPLVCLGLAMAAGTVQRSTQQDRLAGCLANLRSIGQASLTYAAEDPDEIMVPVPALQALPSHPGVFEWGGKAGTGQRTSPSQPQTSVWGTAVWRGPAHRPLNTYLYRAPFTNWNPIDGTAMPGPGFINYLNDTRLDLDVYRCPADTGYAGGGFYYTGGSNEYTQEKRFDQEGLTAYDHYGTSYAANAFSAGGGLSGNRLSSYSAYLRPVSDVPSPAHSIVYQEVPSRFVWFWGSWGASPCVGYESRVEGRFATVPGWHGTNFWFTVAFADGHAAMVEMQGCLRPSPNLGSSNYPPGGCSPSTPNYQCFHCVTIRGPGWQLDTLPAPPVLTPWYLTRSDGEGP